MRLRNVWISALGLTLAVSVACGGKQETSSTSAEPSAPGGTPAGQKVDTGTAGEVKGTVALDGIDRFHIRERLGRRPLVLAFGSFT